MRARHPDQEGSVEREGVRLFYEIHGEGPRTVFFLPTWSIIHSRHWKAQLPYFARHFRVLTFDGRGNGRSDRPADTAAYGVREFAARFNATWEELTADAYRYVDLGNRVLTLTHLRGRGRDAIEVMLEMGHVWTVRDGLIVRMDAFADPQKALEAVGLSE